MSDPATPVGNNPVPETVPVKVLAQDALDAAALGQKIVRAYRSGGMPAASAFLSQALATVEKDYQDVQAALPAIKAGYKTSEFWLTFGVVLVIGGYSLFTGKQLPLDTDATLAAVAAIYTVARALVKKTAA